MILSALLERISILQNTADLSRPVTAVTADSRRVEPGCVFVCVAGDHFDGHTAAADALLAIRNRAAASAARGTR